ncbi:phenylalanine--tRNA ligase subunit beta, partial [Thermodesulfobacteriota bacterium]
MSMKFTLNWLKQYIDPGMSSAELADRLTMAGLEVDSVDELFAELDENVRVAEVLSVERHPNADKLTLCEVAVGDEKHQVVCGAPNARPGMRTPIALPGARLPSGMVIKKSKIRGETSSGMLCSQRDLGISEEHEGIMDLPDSCTSGSLLSDALQLQDTLIEVDLTPNRPDCTSVIGVAREVGGFTGQSVKKPVQGELPVLTGQGLPFAVEIHNSESCPRYGARMLTGVTIGPSPWWLQRILLAVGLRPINNVVDITNFVMLEYGQPLHAFDFSRLAGGKIIVRNAAPSESITTLDGVKRELEDDMLVICDAEKPVAIAGIMGGEGSQVENDTVDILLESAYFDPVSIRRTVRRLKMGTDSSYRFERGIDPQGVPIALERAVRLMQELTGASVMENGVDHCHCLPESPVLTLRVQRVRDLLGIDITAQELADLLRAIEIDAQVKEDAVLTVTPPSFRVDIEREVDLIEEIARLKGYNEIPTALPVIPMSFPETDPGRILRKQLAASMVSLGFYEAINYSFVTEKHFDMLGLDPGDAARATVCLLNPLAEDQSVMRTTLLPGLLENARKNINHQDIDLRLFEIGKVFLSSGEEQPHEELRITAVLSGRRYPDSPVLYHGNEKVDFYDVKGILEQLFAQLRMPAAELIAVDTPVGYAAPGEHARVKSGGRAVGTLGKVSDKTLKNFGIKQDVFFLDLSLEKILQIPARPRQFQALPKFPSVKWDIALVVPEKVGGGELLQVIQEMNHPLVEQAEIFDIFRGESIEQGCKSIAVSVTYRSREQTLD